MSKVAYIRVSSNNQNTARQLDGFSFDKTFTDFASAKDSNRPKLIELINYVRDGDSVFVHSMDRLARNITDLRNIVESILQKGVSLTFVKENISFNNNSDSVANLMLSILGAVSEFERAMIKERQKEGINIAKKNGVYKGRSKKLTDEEIIALKDKINSGIPKTKVAKSFNISRECLYSYIKNS